MPLSALMRSQMHSGYASVISDKLASRANESGNQMCSRAPAGSWAQREARDVTALVAGLNADGWALFQRFASASEPEASRRLVAVGLPLGGGHYLSPHVLTRLRRPGVAVETGVAAGSVSVKILEALEANTGSPLQFSEFTYLRVLDPEKLIGGVVVEVRLGRDYWVAPFAGKFTGLTEPGFATSFVGGSAGESG